MTTSTVLDLSNIPAAAIPELHRQAEECLQGTIQIALAADARAITLTGVFGGGCVALLAVCATLVAATNTHLHMLLLPAIAGAVSLFISAVFCALAARPTAFQLGGYEPRQLAYSATDEVQMRRYATEDIQARINANRAALVRAARFLNCGMSLALASIPLGVAVYLFSA